MKRFDDENTEGYTTEQLAELNRRYLAALEADGASSDPDADDGFDVLRDSVAELVCREIDDEIADGRWSPAREEV
jgi:hypothetical protein